MSAKSKVNPNKKENKHLIIIIAIIMIIAILGSGGLFSYFYYFHYGKGDVDLGITEETVTPQNVILLIGDGMGLNHVAAGNLVTDMVMSTMPYQGEVKTRSLSITSITDSAAAATAYATGNKTFNGCLSYLNGNNLKNMSDVIGATDMRFGVVATKSVTDATPAAFTAHNKSRSNAEEIAFEQANNANIDVLFGLGKSYFDGYADQLNSGNCSYVNTFDDLEKCDSERIYGIFEDSIPHSGELTLASLTSQALLNLECEDGFFLMVEGSKIDSYSHGNEMDNMLQELISFNEAVRTAMAYAKANKNTTVIVTADHETGNLTLPNGATAADLTDDCFKSGTHTNKNVGYYAYGPCANSIPEILDNTDIFYIITQMLGLSA